MGDALKDAVEAQGGSMALPSFDGPDETADMFADLDAQMDEGALNPVKNGSPTGGRRSGRQAGAKNLKPKEMAAFLVSRFRHPLLGLGEMTTMSFDQIADLMVPVGAVKTKDDLHKAAQFWLSCMKEYMPYVQEKLPTPLDLGDPSLPPIIQMMSQVFEAGSKAGQLGLAAEENPMESMVDVTPLAKVLETEVLEPSEPVIDTDD